MDMAHAEQVQRLIDARMLVRDVMHQHANMSDIDKSLRAAEFAIEVAWSLLDAEEETDEL